MGRQASAITLLWPAQSFDCSFLPLLRKGNIQAFFGDYHSQKIVCLDPFLSENKLFVSFFLSVFSGLSGIFFGQLIG